MDCTHTRDLDGSDVVRGVWVMTVSTDRIDGRWDASEDHGATWRKDFDLIFERTVTRGSPPAQSNGRVAT